MGSEKYLIFPIVLFFLLNNFFEWQILSFFSASHYVSSDFLYIIVLPFIYQKDSLKNVCIFYLIYILIIFLLLIYNEYIILSCFSLEENTIYGKKLKEINYQENNQQIERTSSSGIDDNSDDNDESNHSNNISNNNTQNELMVISNNNTQNEILFNISE